MFSGWKDQIEQLLPSLKDVREFFGKKFVNDPEIMPWDETFIAGSIAPQLNRKVNMTGYHAPISALFQLFGIDIGGMNITYDIFPRRNKSEWGYNRSLDR